MARRIPYGRMRETLRARFRLAKEEPRPVGKGLLTAKPDRPKPEPIAAESKSSGARPPAATGRVGLRLTTRQESEFSRSCLPLTFELATILHDLVRPALSDVPLQWPFHDRVLVWLLPDLGKDVVAFHNASGPDMQEIFQPNVLDSIDAALLRVMIEKIEEEHPDLLRDPEVAVKTSGPKRRGPPRQKS